jgi:UDP-N-acetyl-D-mannosaminuronic acid transferase (WecB/TagA/CpsF family)
LKVNLNDELEKLYHNFFKQMNINSNTGIIEGTTHRFATKMAVGENYENAKSKILFISLDIGKDERYIVYHRFNYPKGIGMGDAAGYNREVCIDKLEFNADGTIKRTTPTHKGIEPVKVK